MANPRFNKTSALLASHGESIKRHYLAGWSTERIAWELGLFTPAGRVAHSLVLRVLKRLGVTTRPKGPRGMGFVLRSKHAGEIVRQYAMGMSAYALAKKYQVERRTIRNILLAKGIKLSSQGGARKKLLPPEAFPLLCTGIHQKDLASRLHLTLGQVRRRETNSGVPNRGTRGFQVWCERMSQEVQANP